MKFDVLIVGAGAAGMYCACRMISRQHLRIAIIDSNSSAGKKLLMTGGGRCNITNEGISPDKYHTDSPDRLRRILDFHTSDDFLKFVRYDLGVLTSNNKGLYYPSTYRAETMVSALRNYLTDKGTEFIYDTPVHSVRRTNDGYIINDSYECSRLVFATGGASYPGTGSNGSYISILAPFLGKNDVEPLYPALVPLKTLEKDTRIISGTRSYCDITLYAGDDTIASSSGEILFTDYGVSGICVLDISGAAVRTVAAGKKPVLSVNLLKKDSSSAEDDIRHNIVAFPSRIPVDALNGLIREDILKVILKRSKLDKVQKASMLSDNDIRVLAENMTSFKMTITGCTGFDNAQVTSGGIKLSAVTEDMELCNSEGIFICGESLNCNGICGGYNLQFCWSSAAAAAEGVLKCMN